ncbi:zinc protease [Bacteroidia bacterium]|nr:zinc protease [Bacteroidia bacterium]
MKTYEMKKTFLLLAFAALTTLGFAQSPAQLPTDSAVIYGKLDNGLTYYIRHNEFPEKRADFYIAQRVGSMQEEDDQAGLAHFLEHMMFNGTKNFPGKKTMLNWLETVGVKFGANANAYTSFDETVYNLSSVPVTRQGIIDSCLLVLHDWSGFASLTNEQIDEERLIIKEEWRTRNTPSLRTAEKQLSDILVGSKYANRMPIGSMDVVENFPYQTLKDYYKKWYRPDLQAIIIVGDVDAKAVEAKLKTLFADVPKPVDAAERLYFPVPDNAETIVSIALDPEATQTRVDLYLKHPLYPKQHKKTAAELTYTLLKNVATQILADRLQEIAQTADAPFVASTAFDREFSIAKTKDAWTSIAMSKENKVSESLVILVRENERIKQYGFTDAEIERAKANLLQRFETQYNNRNKTKNDEYVREYVSAFTDDEAIPGIEFEYDFVKGLLPQVNAQALNGLAKYLINDKNTVISVLGPEKEGLVYPTPDELRAVYTKAAAEKVEAYQETVSNEPLIAQLPKAGKVVKTEHDTKFGATVWTLSNGMKVVLKKTDYKDDQIVMHGLAYGGTSNFSDADFFNADMIEYVPDFGGIGNFSVTDLKKALAGKSVNGKIKVNSFSQSLEGSSTIKDVETLLQLGYLYFTAPRKDESVYNSQMAFYKNYLKNQSKEPTFILSQHLAKAKYGNNPRMQPMTFEDAEKLNYDRIIEIYRQMFANPGSFTFTFVGTIDEQALKPLVEQYLASLPSGNKKATYNKGTIAEIKTGEIADIFNQEMKAPKTTAYELYSGKLPYNQKNRLTINALKQVFDIVFQRAVRDEAGGAYGVRTSVSIRRIPSLQTTLQISFDTDPARAANITPIIGREVKKLIEHGPEAADFQKVKEYMLKQFQDDEKTNDYWRDVLTNAYFYDDDIHSNYRTILDALTPEDIQKLANELVVERNFIEVIMHPAK